MEAASLRYGPAMDSSASASLSRSFEQHLRAKNLSDGTVASYLVGLRQFTAFLQPHGRGLTEATRADLEAFVGDLLRRWSPATASTRYKQLQALYRWLEDEEEIADNPMARMKPPAVPDKPIPVVPEDALRRLLAACAGKSFEARRDTAMITFLIDTGARRGEIAGLRVADLDFDLDVALVLGKGRRERALPFGRTTAVALDRYLRVRARHKHAALPWLWLGIKGRLTPWGLVSMLRRCSRQAGLPELHPHQFRHTFAHQWLAQGGGETDLMRLAGWSPAPCCNATAPRPPTLAPVRPTAACLPPTGSEDDERFLIRHICGMRSSSVSNGRPGTGWDRGDRGCPLVTVLDPPVWHASGTAAGVGRPLHGDAAGLQAMPWPPTIHAHRAS
jgi:site-specific recombinase XerD